MYENRPNVVVTYGGDGVSIAVQQLAVRYGAKTVFALHNFGYTDRAAFAAVDYVVVPSEFSRRYHREKLGLECQVLPYVVYWKEAEVKIGNPKSETLSPPVPGPNKFQGQISNLQRPGTLHPPSLIDRPASLSRPTSRSSLRWGLRAYTSLRRSPTRWRGAGRTYPSLSRKAAVTPTH